MPVSLVTPSTSVATSSPKLLADLLQRRARVLDGVVQQRRAQRLGVEPHARADLRDADRVDDEVLAGLAPLVGVVLAGEDERLLRPRRGRSATAESLGVLLDDREQIAESSRALVVVEVRARDGDAARLGHLVHRRTPARDPRGCGAGWALRRSGCRLAQICPAVPESLLIVAEGRGALEVRALRRPHGHRSALGVCVDEAELGEDPQQPPGERRRARGACVTAQDRLQLRPRGRTGAPEGPVRGGQRVAQSQISLMDRPCEA